MVVAVGVSVIVIVIVRMVVMVVMVVRVVMIVPAFMSSSFYLDGVFQPKPWHCIASYSSEAA